MVIRNRDSAPEAESIPDHIETDAHYFKLAETRIREGTGNGIGAIRVDFDGG
jgi:hypothetical protein